MVASPVIAGDIIVNNCGKGVVGKQLSALRDPRQGEMDITPLYTLTGKVVPYVPTPIAVNKRLFTYHDAGLVTCLDLGTGKTIWSEKPGGRFYGSPICVNNRLYCINRKGQVSVIKATDQYELLAVNDLGEPSSATPAISKGRMFLRTLTQLICVKNFR